MGNYSNVTLAFKLHVLCNLHVRARESHLLSGATHVLLSFDISLNHFSLPSVMIE